ncbi:MAG: sensor histidine kinase [Proteobacteria bacterium]|nr:sensor histidine kinase [Pseudomonadota bacterium]MBU1717382.1 sensor histidine kinase [Pseudomonadota bacterium]
MSSQALTVLLIAVSIAMSGVIFIFFLVCLGRIENNLLKSRKKLETEVEERIKAERQIKSSLDEKELLLIEIHHRVKNNMQIVSSLLKLQCRQTDDPHVIEILNESQNRIQAMALIHETFYQPGNLTTISIREYIKNMAINLFDTYAIDPERIQLITEFEGISMGIDTATPCGLIINELITNCLKYAFPNKRPGKINITVKKDPLLKEFQLIVQDNGVGLPRDLDIYHTKTLGLQLVVNLTTNQLQGSVEVHRAIGTTFIISFKELEYKRRI